MANNFEPLFIDSALEPILNEMSGRANQKRATFILKLLVETYKDEIIKRTSQDEYDRLHKKYSMTAYEQKQAKDQKEQEKMAKHGIQSPLERKS